MAKKIKKLNNVQFVNSFINFGSPMNQIFVMDAIGKLARIILSDKEQVRESMKDSFIHPEAWIKCAEDWKKQYDENYKD